MSEPLTVATGIAAGSAGVTFAALFPEATPAVMLCALAGAALYVISKNNYQFWKQAAFAFISFIGGIFSAGFFSELLAGVINSLLHRLDPDLSVKVPHAVGALVASVVCVTALLKILRRIKNYPNR